MRNMETEYHFDRDAWVKEYAQRFFRFDCIRLSKLYELVFYTLLTVVVSIAVGAFINQFCAPYAHQLDKYSTASLLWVSFISILLIVLGSYYIPKFVKILPVLFPVGCGYHPSLHGEADTGTGIAMGIGFFLVISNFYAVLNEVIFRLMPNMFRYNKPDSVGA